MVLSCLHECDSLLLHDSSFKHTRCYLNIASFVCIFLQVQMWYPNLIIIQFLKKNKKKTRDDVHFFIRLRLNVFINKKQAQNTV